MSAYIVEDHLIDFVLSFYKLANYDRYFYLPHSGESVPAFLSQELTKIGQILVNENYRSVNHRYSDSDEPHAYNWKMHGAVLKMQALPLAIQVMKACDNFDYQACETNDWQQTDAHAIIDRIRSAAVHSLPGYEAAQWGAPEHSGPAQLELV